MATDSSPPIEDQTEEEEPLVEEKIELERCSSTRVVHQVGYGEADLHCQFEQPKGEDKEHLHRMSTEADGVHIRYSWR